MKSKGIFDLLEAIKIVYEFDKKIVLNIAGGFVEDEFMSVNEVKKKFYEKIKGLEYIKFHGIVRGKGKEKLLQSSQIFILPSYYRSEAFPITIIEAMAAGNAIIVTNHNYLSDIIKKTNGIVVEKNNPEKLAEAIIKLIKDKSYLQSIRKNNIIYAAKNFSEEQYLKKLEQIINL
jgi:glycosyltransferase involved in cell wall biosynthesis